MASKTKGTKQKAIGNAVTRRISVPQGTRQITVHITIGRISHGKKKAKSSIDDDPMGGRG